MTKLLVFGETSILHYIPLVRKQIVLIAFLTISMELLWCQQIIHSNTYDIRKTNISALLYFRPLEVANAGPQIRVSHYFVPRIMLVYNGYFGLYSEHNSSANFMWGPPNLGQKFLQNTLETDLHLIDYSKRKDVFVSMPRSVLDSTSQSFEYSKFSSSVRRALCFTGGIQFEQNTEKFIKKKEEMSGYNSMPMIDLNTGRDTILQHARIATNTSYTNILVGIKFKSIGATTVKYNDENSSNDIHLEVYGTLIIPVSYDYHKDMYNNFSPAPTHRLHDFKPKTGFRIGVFHRNSIRDNWCFGTEFGVNPTILPSYWRGAFIHLSLGFSLNLGKIKYLNP